MRLQMHMFGRDQLQVLNWHIIEDPSRVNNASMLYKSNQGLGRLISPLSSPCMVTTISSPYRHHYIVETVESKNAVKLLKQMLNVLAFDSIPPLRSFLDRRMVPFNSTTYAVDVWCVKSSEELQSQ